MRLNRINVGQLCHDKLLWIAYIVRYHSCSSSWVLNREITTIPVNQMAFEENRGYLMQEEEFTPERTHSLSLIQKTMIIQYSWWIPIPLTHALFTGVADAVSISNSIRLRVKLEFCKIRSILILYNFNPVVVDGIPSFHQQGQKPRKQLYMAWVVTIHRQFPIAKVLCGYAVHDILEWRVIRADRWHQ